MDVNRFGDMGSHRQRIPWSCALRNGRVASVLLLLLLLKKGARERLGLAIVILVHFTSSSRTARQTSRTYQY
jgi:hypothetical protein